jgi:hypothetical protein
MCRTATLAVVSTRRSISPIAMPRCRCDMRHPGTGLWDAGSGIAEGSIGAPCGWRGTRHTSGASSTIENQAWSVSSHEWDNEKPAVEKTSERRRPERDGGVEPESPRHPFGLVRPQMKSARADGICDASADTGDAVALVWS